MADGYVYFNISEARGRLSELLNRAAEGERIIIMRRGRPIAALVSPDDYATILATPIPQTTTMTWTA